MESEIPTQDTDMSCSVNKYTGYSCLSEWGGKNTM